MALATTPARAGATGGGRRLLSTLLAAVIAATSITVVTAPMTATQVEARERHKGKVVWKKKRGPHYSHRRHYEGRRPYYSDRRWDRRHHRYYSHRRHNNGAIIGAGIAGLAAGAIIGGAIAGPSYAPPRVTYNSPPPAGGYPAYSAGWYSYCGSKYRSFDPQSGTFLGYDGYRHYCR